MVLLKVGKDVPCVSCSVRKCKNVFDESLAACRLDVSLGL